MVEGARVAVKRLLKRERTHEVTQQKGGEIGFVETLQTETVNSDMHKSKMSVTGSILHQ